MSKISDKMREWAGLLRCSAYTHTTAEKISAFADRIDEEMVERPRDKDGKPIHIGDKIYDGKGNGQTALILGLYGEGEPTWTVSTNHSASLSPSVLTHERHDSFERIADELDDFKLGRSLEDLRSIAERIRKLAKEHAE